MVPLQQFVYEYPLLFESLQHEYFQRNVKERSLKEELPEYQMNHKF